jgi:bifunctional N-acetylglucosamine-1-phosphate-uridyltransferase/glucosamine-1-phosphate-acetyltransferase GlmU-like protein
MEKDVVAIIMAGGLGSRMNSTLPKVIHNLDNIPLIVHVLINLKIFSKIKNLKEIFIVVGKFKQQIKETIDKYNDLPNITYIDQLEPLGTGDAIKSCINKLENYKECDVLILSGDVPLFSVNSMLKITQYVKTSRIAVTNLLDPKGYGRIITDKNKFVKIVEDNNCSEKELKISLVNCGIYVFKASDLIKWVPYIKKNSFKGEYYLTDVVELIKNGENCDIELFEVPKHEQYEILGINTIEQLNDLELLIKNKKIETVISK